MAIGKQFGRRVLRFSLADRGEVLAPAAPAEQRGRHRCIGADHPTVRVRSPRAGCDAQIGYIGARSRVQQ